MSEDTPAIREVAASGVSFRVVRTERPTSAEESAALQGIETGQLIRTIVVRRGAATTSSSSSQAVGRSTGRFSVPTSA
jgi:hypothetical protein